MKRVLGLESAVVDVFTLDAAPTDAQFEPWFPGVSNAQCLGEAMPTVRHRTVQLCVKKEAEMRWTCEIAVDLAPPDPPQKLDVSGHKT